MQTTTFEFPHNARNTYTAVRHLFERTRTRFTDIRLDNGATYVGTLDANSKFSGKGIYTYPDGSVYDGLWENGLRSGTGKMMWADGSQYIGNWKNYHQYGNGTMKWANGRQFSGRWKHGSFV